MALPPLTLCSSASLPLQLLCSWMYQLPGKKHVDQRTEPRPKESGLRSSCPGSLWGCRSSWTPQVKQWPTGCTTQGCCQRNPRKIRASPKPAPTCSQLPQMNKHFGTSGDREVPSDLTWACAFHLLRKLCVPWSSFKEKLKSHFNLLH